MIMRKVLRRTRWFVLVSLALLLLCLHSSSSAKVHSGKWRENTKWYYDTKTKTVTIDCKGKMDDDFADHGDHMGWREWYNKIRKVVFKKGITYIGGGSFENFQELEEVVLPEGLESIGSSAFWGTKGLKVITFPHSLKKVERWAFEYSGLTKVHLCNVERLGSDALGGTNIRKLTIPSTCKEIKSYSFSCCTELKKVKIEDGIKVIRKGLFLRAGLEKVTIPSSVTQIESDAFFAFSPEESKLKHVTIKSTQIKKWGKDIFGKARKDLVIQVPKSKKKEYTKELREGGLPEYVKIVGK